MRLKIRKKLRTARLRSKNLVLIKKKACKRRSWCIDLDRLFLHLTCLISAFKVASKDILNPELMLNGTVLFLNSPPICLDFHFSVLVAPWLYVLEELTLREKLCFLKIRPWQTWGFSNFGNMGTSCFHVFCKIDMVFSCFL